MDQWRIWPYPISPFKKRILRQQLIHVNYNITILLLSFSICINSFLRNKILRQFYIFFSAIETKLKKIYYIFLLCFQIRDETELRTFFYQHYSRLKKKRHRIRRKRAVIAGGKSREFRFIQIIFIDTDSIPACPFHDDTQIQGSKDDCSICDAYLSLWPMLGKENRYF